MSNDQQYPYEPYEPYDPQQAQQHHQYQQHQQQRYGQQGYYDPQAQAPHNGHGDNGHGNGHGPYDSGAAQTWSGPTWDTQYQPQVSAAPLVDETAYLPPQAPAPAASYPLPPEAPQSAYGTRASYEPAYAPEPATTYEPAPEPTPVPVPADSGPAYSPPTVGGNARITDAQRARAEGRSPIIAPGMQPAALTAALGLLMAGGAALGQYGLLVPLVLLQALTAAGWFRLNGMWPARQGIALAALGGFTADAVLLGVGREHAPAAIVGTLGVWVLLTLVLQLRSRAGADERMYGLMATVVSAALAIVATGHLAADADAVTVGCAAVAVATLARAVPLPGAVSVLVALAAAAGAGIAVGGLTDLGSQGALLGLATGGCALIGLRVASYDYPSKFVHMTAGVALPLAVAAPAVYLIGRAIA
ncbi:hypothetical protein [Streptomyces sp. NPDC050504]|uniref:hypothetical protein n=1 Tax=Streptomyces sp. NPDC050504 TaxID=3365618 RepID=UPI0037A9EE36